MKQTLLKKTGIIFFFCLSLFSALHAQNPGLIISEFLVNPAGNDSPFEYVEFRVSKYIDFSITPYSVVVCNNGNATSAGWVAGLGLTYGFSINTGTVNAGDVVYVGGSSMAPLGTKLRVINTGTTAGDGFGSLNTGGVFGNGGSNADGIAVFAASISALTNTTVPVDAIFYGTAMGTATLTSSYELPVNDLYSGGKIQSTSFLAADPGAVNLIASGTYDIVGNTYTSNRTWSAGALTDGTSSVTLAGTLTPANLAFSVDNQTVLESIGTVTANISITSSNANLSSVEVVVIPFGTASVGSDLAYTTQTVTFPGNATGTRSLTITINDDALGEESEYFVLKFQNPVNATLPGITQQTIFIKDNENSAPVGNNEVTMSFVSSFTNGVAASNSAEIVAHDPISQRLFVANSIGKKLDIIDFSNPASMSMITSVDISTYGNINSVAVKNGIVACAIENTVPEQDGFVVFFNTNGVFQKQVTVGALPDMITFNHAGTKVLTANEGQPNVGYTIDPEGSVSIIDISGGIASLSQSNVTTALFTSFNSQIASLKAAGVRIYGPGSTVSQDMEPEYITVSEDDLTAYVTLQENNAFAYVNLTTNTITDIKPLGFKDLSVFGNGLDATNNGSNVNIANWPIKGMYLPDALTHFNVGGVEYLITANEGDARADYGAANNEETSIGAATYSLDPTVFPYASVMKSNANLGKLKCTSRLGDTDNDGDYDEIYTFGTRSFSIWNATTGTLVYDSGDDLEQITAADPVYGAMFNCSNTNITKKDRSDDKGPEPEGVAVAMIAGKPYAFVSMERVGGLIVFNISDPTAPKFVQYVNNRGLTGLTGDRGPEGIIYVKQPDSPTGKAYIVLGNEVSSSVSVYEIACPASSATLAAVTSTAACVGNTITVSTSTLSGATYVWYNGTTPINGATSATYNATVSGNYSVKLNNVGCAIASNSVSLTFNALPSVSIAPSSASTCGTQIVSLNLSGASTYTWTDNSNNSTYTVAPTTDATYSVTGTDVNGCIGNSAITITVNTIPTISVSAGSTVICSGNTTSLTASGASTYTWTNGPNTSTYSINPTTDATYTVTGTDGNNCSNTGVITVSVNAAPTISVSASNTVICSGNTTSLTASGASTYTWTNGPNASTYSVNPTTDVTYTVTGTDVNNCSNTGVITISVNTVPTISVSASNTVICSGNTTSLTASGASTYTWTNGPHTSTYSVSPTTSTSYTVAGTDANNCSNTSVITVSVNQLPTVSAVTSNSLICRGESVVLTATSNASSYTWSNGALTMSVSVSPSITTVYSVTVDDGSCTASATVTQSVSLCTGLADINNDNSLNIYPNPFNSSFDVKWENDFSNDKETTIVIYNTLGEIMLTQTTAENNTHINTKDWKNGTYFIRINNKVYKIIKSDI